MEEKPQILIVGDGVFVSFTPERMHQNIILEN